MCIRDRDHHAAPLFEKNLDGHELSLSALRYITVQLFLGPRVGLRYHYDPGLSRFDSFHAPDRGQDGILERLKVRPPHNGNEVAVARDCLLYTSPSPRD